MRLFLLEAISALCAAESFDFFFEVSKYTGTIRNCEGDKCADMQYFTLDEVAKLKNVVSTTRISLAGLANGEIYSECKSYRSESKDTK